MSLFMIETSVIESSASSVGKLASQVSNLSSSVSGYDVSCNGEFDFESVKNTIVSNIEACITKISNTSAILNAVSESHTKLQNNLKFNDSSKETSKSKSSGSSSSADGGYYSSAGYSAASVGAAIGISAVTSKKLEKKKSKNEIIEFKKVDYVYFEDENVTDESKKIVLSENFSYDEKGYGKFNDYYVVAVDESYGKVGDVIRFTKEDGEVVEAVIGFNTGSKSKDESIHFVVTNDEGFKFNAIDTTKNILNDNKKIENVGYYHKLEKDNFNNTTDENLNKNQNDSQSADSSIIDDTATDKVESN